MLLSVIGIAFLLLYVLYLLRYPKSIVGSKTQCVEGYITNTLPRAATFKIPWLSHTLIFASGGLKLASALRVYCGVKFPIRFDLLGHRLFFISSPDNIRAVLFNPQIFSTHRVRARFIKQVLGLSTKAISIIEADTSGPLRQPLPGSNVPPNRRVLRMQQENTFDILSKTGTRELLPKYMSSIEEGITARGIGYDWVEIPDLFIFLRDLALEASVNTLCGRSFLEQSSGFTDAFWTFDANIHYLHMGFPRWWRPAAARAREECLEFIARWRRTAIERSRGRKEFDDSIIWDDVWGSKIMRERNEMYNRFPEWDERSRAGADLGIIWAANDNFAPIMYWFMIAMLQESPVQQSCMEEMKNSQLLDLHDDAVASMPKFDSSVLFKRPFLQSMFNEVLRTEATSMLVRSVEQDTTIGNCKLSKGTTTLVATHLEHMDKVRWESSNIACGRQVYPVEEFWPERFLEFSKNSKEPTISLKGLEGTFIPFGIGHHLCPGRHFATRGIISISALLMHGFDIELKEPHNWAGTIRDYRLFGYSSLRNASKTAFRIKRKLVF